jgi:hypothetical protein
VRNKPTALNTTYQITHALLINTFCSGYRQTETDPLPSSLRAK